MFEEHINLVVDKILESFKDVDVIYLNDVVTNQSVDEAYRVFINAERSLWIYNEKKSRNNHRNFDFNHPEFFDLFNQIDSIYEAIAKLDFDGFRNLIEYSVRVRLSYLTKPKTTLSAFLMNGKESSAISELRLRLDYFDDYKYLIVGVKQFLEEKINSSTESITRAELTESIEQVDKNFIDDLDFESFVDLTDAIISFFNVYNKNIDEADIPLEAALMFLKEKSMYSLSEFIEHESIANDFQYLTKANLLELFSNYSKTLNSTNSDSLENIIDSEISVEEMNENQEVIEEAIAEIIIDDTINNIDITNDSLPEELIEITNDEINQDDFIENNLENIDNISIVQEEENEESILYQTKQIQDDSIVIFDDNLSEEIIRAVNLEENTDEK